MVRYSTLLDIPNEDNLLVYRIPIAHDGTNIGRIISHHIVGTYISTVHITGTNVPSIIGIVLRWIDEGCLLITLIVVGIVCVSVVGICRSGSGMRKGISRRNDIVGSSIVVERENIK